MYISKIVGGLRYNTSTAEEICAYESDSSRGDFRQPTRTPLPGSSWSRRRDMAPTSSDHEGNPPRRYRSERLTVELPAGTLTALKIHVAQREVTIREVVTRLVQDAIKLEGNQA